MLPLVHLTSGNNFTFWLAAYGVVFFMMRTSIDSISTSPADSITVWSISSLSFSRDPFADICWAVLKRDIVRFTALEKTNRFLIHEDQIA